MPGFDINPLLIIFITFAVQYGFGQKPWEPTKGKGADWIKRHEAFLKTSQTNGSAIKIVFIGSSSIEHWAEDGLSIWNQKYGPLGAVNYGIGRDRTENVIWRIQNGELNGLAPQLVILYIGSNNVPSNATVEEIQCGVATVFSLIREKLPRAKVIYMAFFPRAKAKGQKVNETWAKIRDVNEAVAESYDGDKDVTVLDIFWDLAAKWGRIKEELYRSDRLHLNANGYRQWDRSMNDTFYRLLNSE